VNTATERDQARQRPFNIEPIRILEFRRIAVRCAERQKHVCIARYQDALDLRLFAGEARGEVHRAVVAQALENPVRQLRRVAFHRIKLIRVTTQRDQRIADNVRRGFVAREIQRDDVRDDFIPRRNAEAVDLA
jgi:hypothetical protein